MKIIVTFEIEGKPKAIEAWIEDATEKPDGITSIKALI